MTRERTDGTRNQTAYGHATSKKAEPKQAVAEALHAVTQLHRAVRINFKGKSQRPAARESILKVHVENIRIPRTTHMLRDPLIFSLLNTTRPTFMDLRPDLTLQP